MSKRRKRDYVRDFMKIAGRASACRLMKLQQEVVQTGLETDSDLVRSKMIRYAAIVDLVGHLRYGERWDSLTSVNNGNFIRSKVPPLSRQH